jgi:hypothetical protein
MQVVMWLILCATLGLAGIITRSRGVQGTTPVRVGPVIVRLPYGWQQDSLDPVAGLRAHDPDGERHLFVVATPLRPSEIPESGPDYQGEAQVPFKGLHRMGVVQLEHRTTADQQMYTELVATALVPELRTRLRVGFVVPELQANEVDVSLLGRIVAGITAAGASPRPQLRQPDGEVVLDRTRPPSIAQSR